MPQTNNNKIELKLKKFTGGSEIYVDDMSIEATKAFIIFLESLTKIAEMNKEKDKVRIQVTKGSAVVSLDAPDQIMAGIERDLEDVLSNKSKNKVLVSHWREIQDVIKANGIDYEAYVIRKGTRKPIIDQFKAKRFTTARKKRKTPVYTQNFYPGKLIEMGGKNPNIHILINNTDKLTIACTEEQAMSLSPFIYKNVLVAVWSKKIDTDKFEHTYCDFYLDTQKNMFEDFSKFTKSLRVFEDETDMLMAVHYKLKSFLDDSKDYGNAIKLMRLFAHESLSYSLLKTILVITKSFSSNERLWNMRQQIKEIVESQYGPLV